MKYFDKKSRIFALLVLLLSVPAAVFLVLQETNFLGRASGISAKIVVDAGTSFTRTNYSWKNLAQGGEANANQEQMLNSVVDKVKILQPEYIRIDHIYDFYDVVSRGSDGQLIFDWSKLDLTVNDILAVGAKPFLSLSYTPKVLSSSNEVSEPTSWNEWQLLVQKTVEHFSGIDGKGIPDVYYEVWNEPDLFGGWKAGGGKNYFDLYYHSAIGANKAENVLRFKIGGPATTALYQNWFGKFLEFVADKTLRLDFYSWHRYSQDIDIFEKDIKTAQKWLSGNEIANRFKNIELIITEMGLDSEVNQLHDTNQAAIHTLASFAAMEGKIDKAFSFEIKDGIGPSQYWGRWGILTHEKFGTPLEKPRYKALEFLNGMKGRRMNVIGQGSWVKAFGSNVDGAIKLLVVNYDKNAKHAESVPITFMNLPAKTYSYKRTDFLGQTSIREINVEGNSLSLIEFFSPNSAGLLELIPK